MCTTSHGCKQIGLCDARCSWIGLSARKGRAGNQRARKLNLNLNWKTALNQLIYGYKPGWQTGRRAGRADECNHRWPVLRRPRDVYKLVSNRQVYLSCWPLPAGRVLGSVCVYQCILRFQALQRCAGTQILFASLHLHVCSCKPARSLRWFRPGAGLRILDILQELAVDAGH